METPTNGELGIMLHDIDRRFTESLARIEDQTTRTNGRVNSLERWQWTTAGGLAVVVALLVPIGITLAIRFFQNHA